MTVVVKGYILQWRVEGWVLPKVATFLQLRREQQILWGHLGGAVGEFPWVAGIIGQPLRGVHVGRVGETVFHIGLGRGAVNRSG